MKKNNPKLVTIMLSVCTIAALIATMALLGCDKNIDEKSYPDAITNEKDCDHKDPKYFNEATCTEENKCSVCGYVRQPKNPDNHPSDNVTAADCATEKFCTACEKLFDKKDPSNHKKGDPVIIGASSICGKPGYTGDKCCKYCEAVLEKGTSFETADGECIMEGVDRNDTHHWHYCTECGTAAEEKTAHEKDPSTGKCWCEDPIWDELKKSTLEEIKNRIPN